MPVIDESLTGISCLFLALGHVLFALLFLTTIVIKDIKGMLSLLWILFLHDVVQHDIVCKFFVRHNGISFHYYDTIEQRITEKRPPTTFSKLNQ